MGKELEQAEAEYYAALIDWGKAMIKFMRELKFETGVDDE